MPPSPLPIAETTETVKSAPPTTGKRGRRIGKPSPGPTIATLEESDVEVVEEVSVITGVSPLSNISIVSLC